MDLRCGVGSARVGKDALRVGGLVVVGGEEVVEAVVAQLLEEPLDVWALRRIGGGGAGFAHVACGGRARVRTGSPPRALKQRLVSST